MSKIEDVSEAIADETEIAAIEEAGIIAQSQSAEDDGNPADRIQILCGSEEECRKSRLI